MKRLAAVFCLAAVLGGAGAYAQRGPTAYGPSPYVRDAPQPELAQPKVPNAELWTEPAGTFSFDKPRAWKKIDTASMPGAPRLELVAGDEDEECWFVRNVNARTATMSAAELMAARAKPIGADLWTRLAANQQLLMGSVSVLESDVVHASGWPIQVARLQSRDHIVYAALHARPGLYVWAFCAAKDNKDRSAVLNAVARSVTTPKDSSWLAARR